MWPLGTLFFGSFLLADPLIAFNSLVHGMVKWELLLAVPVLLSPLFLGRVFCGYVCPMGFLVELFGPRRERHPGPRTRGVLRKVPLFSLVVVAMLILFGSAVFLVFDPLSLFTRSATTLVYPAADRVLTAGGDLFYRIPQLQGSGRQRHQLPHRPPGVRQRAALQAAVGDPLACSSWCSPSRTSSGGCGAGTSARWARCWV